MSPVPISVPDSFDFVWEQAYWYPPADEFIAADWEDGLAAIDAFDWSAPEDLHVLGHDGQMGGQLEGVHNVGELKDTTVDAEMDIFFDPRTAAADPTALERADTLPETPPSSVAVLDVAMAAILDEPTSSGLTSDAEDEPVVSMENGIAMARSARGTIEAAPYTEYNGIVIPADDCDVDMEVDEYVERCFREDPHDDCSMAPALDPIHKTAFAPVGVMDTQTSKPVAMSHELEYHEAPEKSNDPFATEDSNSIALAASYEEGAVNLHNADAEPVAETAYSTQPLSPTIFDDTIATTPRPTNALVAHPDTYIRAYTPPHHSTAETALKTPQPQSPWNIQLLEAAAASLQGNPSDLRYSTYSAIPAQYNVPNANYLRTADSEPFDFTVEQMEVEVPHEQTDDRNIDPMLLDPPSASPLSSVPESSFSVPPNELKRDRETESTYQSVSPAPKKAKMGSILKSSPGPKDTRRTAMKSFKETLVKAEMVPSHGEHKYEDSDIDAEGEVDEEVEYHPRFGGLRPSIPPQSADPTSPAFTPSAITTASYCPSPSPSPYLSASVPVSAYVPEDSPTPAAAPARPASKKGKAGAKKTTTKGTQKETVRSTAKTSRKTAKTTTKTSKGGVKSEAKTPKAPTSKSKSKSGTAKKDSAPKTPAKTPVKVPAAKSTAAAKANNPAKTKAPAKTPVKATTAQVAESLGDIDEGDSDEEEEGQGAVEKGGEEMPGRVLRSQGEVGSDGRNRYGFMIGKTAKKGAGKGKEK